MMEWTCKIGGMQSRDILVSSDSRHKISIQRQYTRLDETNSQTFQTKNKVVKPRVENRYARELTLE